MAATASSGLMVTRTHRPRTLRTLKCHACPKPAKGFMVACGILWRRIAPLLSFEVFAGPFGLLVDRCLHVAGAVEILRQRIEHGLLFGRRIGRRAPGDAQNREHHCRAFDVTHAHPRACRPTGTSVYNTRMFRLACLLLIAADVQ